MSRPLSWIAVAAVLVGTQTGKQPPGGSVPLVADLTIVTAYTVAGFCDCESVKRVTAIDADAIRLTYASDVPEGGAASLFGGTETNRKVQQVRGRRIVRRQDLEHAREYMQLFGSPLPELMPGTTALGVSASVLRDLKSSGRSALTMRSGGIGTALGGLIGALGGPDLAGLKEIKDLDDIDKASGTIVRVEPKPVVFKVLINDRAVELPAVHARGRLGEEDADLYFLDDERNPLALKWTLGDNRLQVIKISFPEGGDSAAGSARIAATLAEKGRVEIYGIYFDFDRDGLRPESELVLRDIAQALAGHPEWKLRVDGHTDNIGTEAHNLDLSRRRAEAVKAALTTRHRVAASRLSTGGFGASRPKDTNGTVEGRARNRRVELVRQ